MLNCGMTFISLPAQYVSQVEESFTKCTMFLNTQLYHLKRKVALVHFVTVLQDADRLLDLHGLKWMNKS